MLWPVAGWLHARVEQVERRGEFQECVIDNNKGVFWSYG